MFGRDRREGMWSQLAHWPLLLAAVLCIAIGGILIRDVPNGNLATAFLLIILGTLMMGAFLAVYLFQIARQHDLQKPPPDEESEG